jgi:hypothetical protein
VAPRRFHGSPREPSAEPWCNPLMSRAYFRPELGPSGWFGPLQLQVTEVARHGPTEPGRHGCDSGIFAGAAGPTRRAQPGPYPRARAKRRPLQTRQCQFHLLRTVAPDWTSHLKWRLLLAPQKRLVGESTTQGGNLPCSTLLLALPGSVASVITGIYFA